MNHDDGRDERRPGGAQEIPGFENLVRIGSGGSSTVYRALDVRHQRPVAIKVLDARTTTGSRRSAFQREIEAIGRIGNHPNIVTVLGSGFTANNHAYLVLPLFDRGTYSQLIDESGPLTWGEATDIGIKLASAVETVHRAGVVHRDIKPGNVFVGVTPEQPLLADFGISSTVDGERTKTQTMAVTFGYTAPEVLDDERPTPASDIYSLAMTIFRLIQGLHAYHAETPAAVMRKMLAESDRPQLSAGVPPALTSVVAGALAMEPSQRPLSALVLARQLQQVQIDHGLPVTGVIVADEPALEAQAAVPTAGSTDQATPSVQTIESSMVDAILHHPRPTAPTNAETPDRAVSTPPDIDHTDDQRADVGAILAAALHSENSSDAAVPRSKPAGSLDLPTVVTPRRPRSELQRQQATPEPARPFSFISRPGLITGLASVVVLLGILAYFFLR